MKVPNVEGDTADINAVIQLSPYRLQHVTADHSHGSSNPAAKFFLWGFVRDNVFVPPLPANLHELRHGIRASVAMVSRDMLERVWGELNYRNDICRISKCGHIEYL
ncbi:hypothetical protein C0J52_02584 [Blattella germanica]|nr:hypothetical protein C0J52_02584 [Blattella germanica]